MVSVEPVEDTRPDEPPSSRWRLVLGLLVLVVAVLLVLAAVAFPPRPSATGGGGPPCPTCFSFSVVAGIGGSLTFNDTVPGPTMTVPIGADVAVTLTVDPAASSRHSWMLVPLNGTPSSAVVFAGANSTDPAVGLAPGTSQTFTFTASASGSYKYICGVDSHYLDGMWGYFNVTA